MKTYKFEVIINEGSCEFWEDIGNRTGCDEVSELLKDCLEDKGFTITKDYFIKLIKFEDN